MIMKLLMTNQITWLISLCFWGKVKSEFLRARVSAPLSAPEDVISPPDLERINYFKRFLSVFGDSTGSGSSGSGVSNEGNEENSESDSREEFDGLPSIGRIQTEKGHCTGTMVGRRLMVTAQHCLNRKSDGSIGWMKFYPQYYGGNAPFGSAYATQVWSGATISLADDYFTEHEAAFDWVVVLLNEEIGDDTGWMNCKLYNSNWDGEDYFYLAGYPDDKSSGRYPYWSSGAVDLKKSYTDSGGDVSYALRHRIDASTGNSGGPIFSKWSSDDRYSLVGIQSIENTNTNTAAGGPEMCDYIERLRAVYG